MPFKIPKSNPPSASVAVGASSSPIQTLDHTFTHYCQVWWCWWLWRRQYDRITVLRAIDVDDAIQVTLPEFGLLLSIRPVDCCTRSRQNLAQVRHLRYGSKSVRRLRYHWLTEVSLTAWHLDRMLFVTPA